MHHSKSFSKLSIRALVTASALLLALSASAAHAEPTPRDSLKMRHEPRLRSDVEPFRPTQPATTAKGSAPDKAAPPPADPATVAKATREAAEMLELCYELARRSDTTLTGAITVHATVRADASIQLSTQAQNLGSGYFARCVERKLAALVTVNEPPAADAATRVITVGNR